jgi:hypothetical protein
MMLFLELLSICAVGGFLVTSLVWVLFWAVGVFEAPQSVKKMFGASVSKSRENTKFMRAVYIVEYDGQSGMEEISAFEGIKAFSHFKVFDFNSASARKYSIDIPSNGQSAAHPYAFTRN